MEFNSTIHRMGWPGTSLLNVHWLMSTLPQTPPFSHLDSMLPYIPDPPPSVEQGIVATSPTVVRENMKYSGQAVGWEDDRQ